MLHEMESELATSLSDVLLAVVTFFLATKFKSARGQNTWRAFFYAMAAAAGFGALYHGFDKLHTPSFWVLVSSASMTSSFLFFAACSVSGRVQWKWLSWLWPFFGLAGIVVGTFLATMPFWAITTTSTLLIFASLYILQGSPSKECRQWIMLGIGTTILGFIIQKVVKIEGPINNNVIFHLLQLTGNYFIYLGAKKA